MSSGEVLSALLVLSFALLVTVHVSLVFGLAKREPRWHAAIALVLPPLAPLWGWTGLRGRSLLWGIALVAYGVLRVLAAR